MEAQYRKPEGYNMKRGIVYKDLTTTISQYLSYE
jgi:hypothetical protein